MNKGKIKFFNTQKGFGFIVADNGQKDVFFHVSGLVDEIRQDDVVTFDLAEDKRGPRAVNVKMAR